MELPPSERSATGSRGLARARVIVANTKVLSFVSSWRAAAFVLTPMLSAILFSEGVVERTIGKTAPWFIVAAMLVSGTIFTVYLESSTLSMQDKYSQAKVAMGSTLAKLSLSVLLVNHLLMGSICVVFAVHYLTGLLMEWSRFAGHTLLSADYGSYEVILAVTILVFLWWMNSRRTREYGGKNLQIVVLVVTGIIVLILWCLITIFTHGFSLPPFPLSIARIAINRESVGLLSRTSFTHLAWLVVLMSFGHAVLAMSGAETLSQIARDIEHPKLKNLKRAALLIFLCSSIATSLISCSAVMIIPDNVRPQYFDNLISGMIMYLVGPTTLKLIFQIVVVFSGIVLLGLAADTSIRTSSDLITRASKDALLPDRLRRIHPKFGTAYLAVTLVTALQILIVLASRSNVVVLAATYAFCIIWTFAIQGFIVLRLRYAEPGVREFRVPLNLRIGRIEIPVGLCVLTIFLAAVGFAGLFGIGSIEGTICILLGLSAFAICEQVNLKRSGIPISPGILNLSPGEDLSAQALGVRPGNVLVVLHDYNTIYNLTAVLDRVDVTRQDVAGVHIRVSGGVGSAEKSATQEGAFTVKEQELLELALNVAESKGKPLQLAVIAADELWDGILHAAHSIQSATIVLGIFPRRPPREEFLLANMAWERLSQPKPHLSIEIYAKNSERLFFSLGPHAPRLTENQIELVHSLWLRCGEALGSEELEHNDIVHFALLELERQIEGRTRDEMLESLKRHLLTSKPGHRT